MFFNQEDLYIPPCCDQKYFRALWEWLGCKPTTIVWPGNDYAFIPFFKKVMEHMPMSNVMVALPYYSTEILEMFQSHMLRQWYNYNTKVNVPYLNRLTLILPKASADDYNKDRNTVNVKIKDRLKVCQADVSQVMMYVTDGTKSVSACGTLALKADSGCQNIHAMTVSVDAHVVQEIYSLLKVNSHHEIKEQEQPKEEK